MPSPTGAQCTISALEVLFRIVACDKSRFYSRFLILKKCIWFTAKQTKSVEPSSLFRIFRVMLNPTGQHSLPQLTTAQFISVNIHEPITCTTQLRVLKCISVISEYIDAHKCRKNGCVWTLRDVHSLYLIDTSWHRHRYIYTALIDVTM